MCLEGAAARHLAGSHLHLALVSYFLPQQAWGGQTAQMAIWLALQAMARAHLQPSPSPTLLCFSGSTLQRNDWARTERPWGWGWAGGSTGPQRRSPPYP